MDVDLAPAEAMQHAPRSERPPRREGGGGRGGRDFRPRRKVCSFCVDKVKHIDYKDVGRLRRYLSDRAKIEPRRKTGTCAKHQRRLSVALKRARFMALLPYTGDHIRGSDRGIDRSAGHGMGGGDRGMDRGDRGIGGGDRGMDRGSGGE